MSRQGYWKRLAQSTALLALLAAPAISRADDTELREYSVVVNGKPAGVSRMTIVQKNDGTTYMSGSADVKFRVLLGDYIVKIDTQEWWKQGRLIGMKTSGSENGKKVDVTVAADNNQLRVRVNGKELLRRADSWTSTYWKLADARFHNKQVPILEVDSGREFNSDLKYVGQEKLKVGNQLQDCYHFLVTAAPGPIDLWYDRYHRLVRQEFTESGHKTIVQLVTVRR
ncbi:MAG: hypothetical protein HYX68_08295 [Planctomycetes bacterium]|nr:hypothetical protein [Planctomycetota bacterium]